MHLPCNGKEQFLRHRTLFSERIILSTFTSGAQQLETADHNNGFLMMMCNTIFFFLWHCSNFSKTCFHCLQESKVQLAIEFITIFCKLLLLVIQIRNCSGYITTYSYEKVHFWHLIPFYQPNQWTDGPGQHSRMIKPGFEVYNPLISYIRQASRKFPKWGLKLCCSPVIQNHPRISVMTFQAYFWVERNYSNFWHLLLIRNNPILSVPSCFSVNYFYFLNLLPILSITTF